MSWWPMLRTPPIKSKAANLFEAIVPDAGGGTAHARRQASYTRTRAPPRCVRFEDARSSTQLDQLMMMGHQRGGTTCDCMVADKRQGMCFTKAANITTQTPGGRATERHKPWAGRALNCKPNAEQISGSGAPSKSKAQNKHGRNASPLHDPARKLSPSRSTNVRNDRGFAVQPPRCVSLTVACPIAPI